MGYFDFQNVAIVNSLYVIFETIPELLNSYLKAYMLTNYFNTDVIRNTEGSVREYLFYENFSNIIILPPDVEEQKKIADFLLILENKIILAEDKLIIHDQQKQAFM